MKKSVIIISVIVVILLIALITFLIIKNNQPKSNNPGTQPGVISDEENKAKSEWDDGYVPQNPSNYTELKNENVSGTDTIAVESIAYNYDSGDGITYVNVHIQNRGTEPFYHDSVAVIELYDSNNNFLYRFGGVIESDYDIPVGERTVIKTQFIDKPGDIAFAKVSFEK